MSITTLIEADEPTQEDIENKILALYHTQRVNFEAADDLADIARPLWRTVVKTKISDVAEVPDDRTIPTRTLYARNWNASGTVFDRTRLLATFLLPDMWPEFRYDSEDKAKKEQINVWTELIGLSADADQIYKEIRNTSSEIQTEMSKVEGMTWHNAQAMRGWYVSISTSRRSNVGWVVGGRGQTLHIVQDPLAGVVRITRGNNYAIKLTDKVVSQRLSMTNETAIPSEVEKYNLKTAQVSLIFPPDMARDRREWVASVLPKISTAKIAARPIYNAFVSWKQEADPLIAKDEVYKKWLAGVPEDFGDWAKDGGALRWVQGASEAMTVLLNVAIAAGMSNETLREAVLAEYQARRPDNLLTDAERAIIDAKPAGSADFRAVVSEVLAKEFPGLTPMF